jgi:hypothetical protein
MIRGGDDPVYRKLYAKLYNLDPSAGPAPPGLCEVQPTPLRGVKRSLPSWSVWTNKYESSILMLQVLTDGEPDSWGTAFVLDRDLLATAGHNLDGRRVQLLDANESPVQPTRTQHKNITGGEDWGLLEVDLSGFDSVRGLPTQERIPLVGEEIAAIGYPSVSGRHTTLSTCVGTIESTPESYRTPVRFLQVSFAHIGGMSGSPVIDRRGYVVGIVVENVWWKPAGDTPPVPSGQVLPIGYVTAFRRAEFDTRARQTV